MVSRRDRKSTRLNSSHSQISYAVFCLKKKKTIKQKLETRHESGQLTTTRQRDIRDARAPPRDTQRQPPAPSTRSAHPPTRVVLSVTYCAVIVNSTACAYERLYTDRVERRYAVVSCSLPAHFIYNPCAD